MTPNKIALFIDADNISPKFGKQIVNVLESRGEIFIRRIYGNWEKISLRGWNDCILNFSLRAVQQPDFVTGKNATDMCLTIDAMDVLHDGKAEIFALVSNDSDFTPLVIRLREGGMNIIGLGNSHASNAFRAACNEFIDLDELATRNEPLPGKISSEPTVPDSNAENSNAAVKALPPEKKIPPVQMSLFGAENSDASTVQAPPSEKISSPKVVPITGATASDNDDKFRTIHHVLSTAAMSHADDAGFVAMCWAGQVLHNENLGFSVRDLGYGSLHKFVSDFPDRYELIQRDGGENFCYRCRTIEPKNFPAKNVEPIPADDDKLQLMHDALRAAVAACADADGFANLCAVGSQLGKMKLNFGVRDFGYSTTKKFVAAFPDRYETRNKLNALFLRCRVSKPAVIPDSDKFERLHEILRNTAAARSDETGFTDLSYVGGSLGKQKIGFGIRSLGYSTLKKFVADFPDLYELRKSTKKIFYRCRG